MGERWTGLRPGDRWTHARWPAGTPDAVVGRVENGVVTWAERGGEEVPSILARHLTEALGWRRGHAYAQRRALREAGVPEDVIAEMSAEAVLEEAARRGLVVAVEEAPRAD